MTTERRIVFHGHALDSMHRRDISKDEVLQTLAVPSSRHRFRKDGRAEARQRFGTRVLLVVYIRQPAVILVINAMWE